MMRFVLCTQRLVWTCHAECCMAMLLVLMCVLFMVSPATGSASLDGVVPSTGTPPSLEQRADAQAEQLARPKQSLIPQHFATTSGGTIAFGVATTFTISTVGETAWMTFTGSVGMRVSMKTSMSGLWTSKILNPSGNVIASCKINCNGGTNFIDSTPLAVDGLYKVQLTSTSAGNGTITLYNVPADVTADTTPVSGGGASVPLTISTPGQNAAITFGGYAGERLSWAHFGSGSGQISVYSTTLGDFASPANQFASCGSQCNNGSGFLEPFVLPYLAHTEWSSTPATCRRGRRRSRSTMSRPT
jgi:hypothetical protein